MKHIRGRPYLSQIQRKVGRWHRSMKNRILLENYYLPSELEQRIARLVDYHLHYRYHESLKFLAPADAYHGRLLEIPDPERKSNWRRWHATTNTLR